MKLRHGPGERVPFQRGEAHRLHLQRALQVLLDRFAAAGPAIGIDLDPFARRATEQVVQRQVGVLGDDVPQRDLDRAPGRHQVQRRAAHREVVEHHLRGVADAERAAADHVFPHDLQQVLDHRFLAGRDIGFAPAVQAALRSPRGRTAGSWPVPGSNRKVSMRAIFMASVSSSAHCVAPTLRLCQAAATRGRKQHAIRPDHLRDHRQDRHRHAEPAREAQRAQWQAAARAE